MLPNPYALVAGLLIFLASVCGAFVAGDVRGDHEGSNRVQVAWDNAEKVVQNVRAARVAAANAVSKSLQEQADEDRRKHEEADAKRDARLTAALGELQNRARRPVPGPSGRPAAPPAGPPVVCTGAGLYGDDAEFLTRFADRAQQVRAQRDEYWERYQAARTALEALGQAQAKSP